MIENQRLQLQISSDGYLNSLISKDDPYKMNWVIEDKYLKEEGYDDIDKLFGNFKITINHCVYTSYKLKPIIKEQNKKITVRYDIDSLVSVEMQYFFDNQDQLLWDIELKNKTKHVLKIDYFGVWISFAYVMFRDKNVLRNIHNSAAVFPSISNNYTKMNIVRRDNKGGNLGFYQLFGETKSVGTYCDYENKFFENVSPSLDGLLFHQLILAGGYEKEFNEYDWIYNRDEIKIDVNEIKNWRYVMSENQNEMEFKRNSKVVHQPIIEYEPMNIIGKPIHLRIDANNRRINQIRSFSGLKGKNVHNLMSNIVYKGDDIYELEFIARNLGEHKIEFIFNDETIDFIILNVMEPLDELLEKRVEYISKNSYCGVNSNTPYAFAPISNQGESLGKLNLILKKNLLGQLIPEQVQQVEASAVYYVKNKWFKNGDFKKPELLYGDFYRCMDFEYIGHLFYLLSEFNDDVLLLNSSLEYLKWASEVFELRVNPELHKTDRGKEESAMLGVYFLYIDSLLEKLKKNKLIKEYNKINELWKNITNRIAENSQGYSAAITEHYFDNAGFGPTSGAMSSAKQEDSTNLYGELLLANIGYSNDFRAQNPDRWWEALSYMIHSLWGGITSASAYKVFEFNHNKEYLKASYRALAGILYCYDTNATATNPLGNGLAASTYSVAGPHLNRPDLSRARFGQATFYKNGGIFARLFDNADQTPDWDMGEELVAYLDGLGRKTFVIIENNIIQIINGTYTYQLDKLKIYSFAPYQAEIYLIQNDQQKYMGIANENHEMLLNIDN